MRIKTLVTFAAIALVAAACNSGTEDATTTTATQDDVTTTLAPDGSPDGVHTAETDLGTVLVGADGFTLYVFTLDVDGESTCYDQCAGTWPPVSADSAIGGDLDASIFGSTTRTDGSNQLTVDGKPLYTFAPDTNPGDTNGQGVNDVWFVVDGSGTVIP